MHGAEGSNLVLGSGDDIYYMKLQCFKAQNLISHFKCTNIKKILLLKYVDQDGKLALSNIDSVTKQCGSRICFSS